MAMVVGYLEFLNLIYLITIKIAQFLHPFHFKASDVFGGAIVILDI